MDKMSNVYHFVDGVLVQYTEAEYQESLLPYPQPVIKNCFECGSDYQTTYKRSIRCAPCQVRDDFI